MAIRADILSDVRSWGILFLILFNFLNYVMAYDSCAVFESQTSQCVDWQPQAPHQKSAASQNEKNSSQSQAADIHVCPCLMILNETVDTCHQSAVGIVFQSYFKIQLLSNFSNPLYRPPIATVS